MKKQGIICLVVFFFVFTAFQQSEAKRKNYYRTFEIIGITENSLTLQDSDSNIIEVQKDPGDYRIGYKVRYDSVRKRLRPYRWQDYKVAGLSADSIALLHKTGDTVSVQGNYANQYKIGDSVRYDSVDNKLQVDEESTQWKQFTVVAAASNQIIIRSTLGEEFVLHMDNNVFPERKGVYIPKYKVGEMVRYDIKNNKLKKEVRRTFDWQEYTIKEINEQKLILINDKNEELVLENTYRTGFKAGDQVKYDRLNRLLKKVR